MSRFLLVLAGLLLSTACTVDDTFPVPVEGSTYRIGEVKQAERVEAKLDIFRTRSACRGAGEVGPAEADLCVPQLDRRTGQVKVGFRLLDQTSNRLVTVPLTDRENLLIGHNGLEPKQVELIPHDPEPAAQLFIVVIDGSGSMHKAQTKGDSLPIDKVYKAMMSDTVVNGLFPKGTDKPRAVVLMRFSGNTSEMWLEGLDGGPPQILTSRNKYKAMVRDHIMTGRQGWTWLYDATRVIATDFLQEETIKNWIKVNRGEPTIIMLTDGFNNVAGSDTCASNAPRLSSLLEVVGQTRNAPMDERPTVFTVGLGKPIRPNWSFDDKKQLRFQISPHELCGPHQKTTINANLENSGIDNVSLAYMARIGGGQSFVSNHSKGLAKVFEAAAAMRYQWYEVVYRIDGFYHRKQFETRIKLNAFARAEATVDFHPDPWLDAPSAEYAEADAQWVSPVPFRRTFGLVMPVLGFLVFVSFWGPASFNARRAVFRRAIKGRGAPPPPAPGPQGGPPPAT